MAQIVEVAQKEDRQGSQIRSQMVVRDVNQKKLERMEQANQIHEQEIGRLKAQVTYLQTEHKTICEALQVERQKNETLVAQVTQFKEQQALMCIEKESYLKTTTMIKDAHELIFKAYGNEQKFVAEKEAGQASIHQNSRLMASVNSELAMVGLERRGVVHC